MKKSTIFRILPCPLVLFALGLLPAFSRLSAQQPIQSSVYFLTAKHDLPALASIVMDTLCYTADHRVPWRIAISGHTDADGSFSYNQKLSESRAQTVKKALEDCGITIEGMTVQCFGEYQPVADNESMIGKARNRRVEITLTPAAALPQNEAADAAPGKEIPSVYSLLSRPEFITFPLDPTQDQMIKTPSGLDVFIPAGTYPGKIPCEVKIRTATTFSEVMKMKYTTIGGGKPLESAGMFEMEIVRNGQKLQPVQGKKYIALFPAPVSFQGYSSWTGRQDKNGFTTWNTGLEKGFDAASRKMGKTQKRRWSLIQAIKNLFSPGGKQRRGGISLGERKARTALRKNLKSQRDGGRRMGIAFGFSGISLNGDKGIAIVAGEQKIALRSDSSQVVMLHMPQTFSTFYARSIDPQKDEASLWSVPMGQPAWIVVLRSTKGYLEIASKEIITSQKKESGFEFTAVTAEEAYAWMDKLGRTMPQTSSPLGGN
jgi:hypothetical protein